MSIPRIDPYADPLTAAETRAAAAELIKFPRVIRQNVDPSVPNQTHTLISMDLFKEPKKDKNGNLTYGFFKTRGSYGNEQLARSEAGKLIKTVDSNTRVLIVPTGHWLPVTPSDHFIADKEDVRMNEEEVHMRDEIVKAKDEERKSIMRELKEREDELKRSAEEEHNPSTIENYTDKRNTEMVLTNEIRHALKSLEKLENRRKQVWKELKKLDKAYPNYTEEWIDFMNDVRKGVGLPALIPRSDQFDDYNNTSLDNLNEVPDLRPDESFQLPESVKQVVDV